MSSSNQVLRVLSLGAGVQSSTLALMMKHGEIEPADHAVFADTGAEPPSVYRWLDWLETQVPFPIHRVSNGSIREAVLTRVGGKNAAAGGPPFFTTPNGMLPRQCTRHYKLVPIERKTRELLGLKKGQRGPKEKVVQSVIGISRDEAIRMKTSRLPFASNVYPLVDGELTRGHCLEWMESHGYPEPPKSACTFCPYRSNEGWKRLKASDPEAFEDACQIDDAIRAGYGGTTERLYVHPSMVPLREADFRTASDFGQVDAFSNECEGMCGV